MFLNIIIIMIFFLLSMVMVTKMYSLFATDIAIISSGYSYKTWLTNSCLV